MNTSATTFHELTCQLAGLSKIKKTQPHASIPANVIAQVNRIADSETSSLEDLLFAGSFLNMTFSEFVEVESGMLPKGSGLVGTHVGTFQIAKHAITQDEWQGVRNWAIANGFELELGWAGIPKHPITGINWYDAVKWCNAKSVMEGLEPVYWLAAQEGYYKVGEFGTSESHQVTFKAESDGYRLPTMAEWEWAARGGRSTHGYTFAGSNTLNDVGWYSENSGGEAHAVGEKIPNELGLYDMSGNVWEWCWDFDGASYRRIRGGSWSYYADGCTVASRYIYYPANRFDDFVGFRLARNSKKDS